MDIAAQLYTPAKEIVFAILSLIVEVSFARYAGKGRLCKRHSLLPFGVGGARSRQGGGSQRDGVSHRRFDAGVSALAGGKSTEPPSA